MNKRFNIKTWQKQHLTEDKVSPTTVLEVTNKKLKELGLKSLKKLPAPEKNITLGKGKIDPKTLGLFGHAFVQLNYEAIIYYSEDEKDQYVRINLSFNYKHPSGSNGITVTYAWNSYYAKWEVYS